MGDPKQTSVAFSLQAREKPRHAAIGSFTPNERRLIRCTCHHAHIARVLWRSNGQGAMRRRVEDRPNAREDFVTSNSIFKRKALRGGAALQALALLGAGLTTGAVLATPASAQDFNTGALVGTALDANGAPLVGASVTVRSTAQGFTRTVSTNDNGSFRVQALPPGSYNVTVATASGEEVVNQTVAVNPAQNTAYTFRASAAPASTASADGDEIVVVGSVERVNDFASNTGGLTIGDVSELLNTTPIARNQTALILLSPGASQGDTAFGNLASIGGATVAENAYYVNGLNVTNFRNFLGSNNPPIEFYQSLDVKLFGIPAEFGRALGGFTTATTKSGSNSFKAGALVTFAPDALRDDSPDTYAAYNRNDYSQAIETNFYVSGPIIKDRLFFYALYNPNYSKVQDSSISTSQRLTTTQNSPFFGGKLDFIIADGHRLEGTYFRNARTAITQYDDFAASVNPNGNSITPVGSLAIGAPQGSLIQKAGGDNFVGTYTGQFTPWLTLSAAYGESHDDQAAASSPLISLVQSTRTGITTTARGFSTANSTDTDVRKFYRADADVYVNLLGTHHFRAGYEREDLSSTTDTRYAGNYAYLLTAGYVRRRLYQNVGTWKSQNESFYIQDSWSLLNERLNLQLGVRNDRFSNDALNGDTYFKSGDQWGPRLGASFDVFGDKRTTIRGSWSRYFFPVATNTNIRLGGAELYYEQRFAYPAGVSSANFDSKGLVNGLQFDANGNIVGLTTPVAGSTNRCPSVGPDANALTCRTIFSDGIQGPTDTLVSASLQPSYTDEWTIGAQQRLGDWDFNVTYINRRLGRTLDDVAIDAAVLKYCTANGIAGCASTFSGFHQYVLANPGSDITVRLDGDCAADARQCQVVTLKAADLGYPKATRNYDTVQFQFNRPYKNGWGVGGSYAYTRLRGNYEGAVKSDNGQTDAGLTQDFDQPGLLDGAYGDNPNQRKHSFKLYGTYQLFNSFRVGANMLFESPRSFSCYGVHPTDAFAAAYANASYYCKQPQFSKTGASVLVPRGSAFKSDWRKQIDVAVQYDIAQFPGSFIGVDVFNVFNFKSKLDYNEFGENADGTLNTRYAQPLSYQPPRFVRFTLGLRFGEAAR
ncbi:TonB-dependent receptor [Sphingomonas donggukensis]|uniref:TonB-dependent receptor n=1 Tax=Sphingomonas donggukensis TaxID=2949093 RepID=A0ABY4TU28_9SPHN|nr:TonB-dependent receptor [Sphingomonas donggukensis]URW75355.1 TonB-dependent receptor [Sphingomonas donggukensis]